jgi:hypothetical protein
MTTQREVYKVLLVGASGKGKTMSFRNFDRATTGFINIENKPLPFPGRFEHTARIAPHRVRARRVCGADLFLPISRANYTQEPLCFRGARYGYRTKASLGRCICYTSIKIRYLC